MHQVLITVFVVFLSAMIISYVAKNIKQDRDKIKSEITAEELKNQVSSSAEDFLKVKISDLNLESITAADFYFFKNKRELDIVLKTESNVFLLQHTFKNLSPGYGLRENLYELTPPEGVYSIDYPGYTKRSGLFVRVQYPPAFYKDYQRIDFETLEKDPILISEKVYSASFIQAEKETMNVFIYLISKLDAKNIRILIYPDRPPLTMELGGTEFTANIYKNLENEYSKLEELSKSQK